MQCLLGEPRRSCGCHLVCIGFQMWRSTKDFLPGMSFAGSWEIGSSSTDGIVTCLAGVGDLGVEASHSLSGRWGAQHLSWELGTLLWHLPQTRGVLGSCRLFQAPGEGPRHLPLSTPLASKNLLRSSPKRTFPMMKYDYRILREVSLPA